MGILSDLLAAPLTYSNTPGSGRHVYSQLEGILNSYGEMAYPTGDYDAGNEVQSIAIFTAGVDGGTFTLAFTLKSGETFETANIAFGANAATIEAAIDTAAALASVVDFTAGDITVAGGPLSTTPATFTFDGASVASQNHGLIVVDGSLLTDGGVPLDPVGGAVTQTTPGNSARAAWAFLKVAGIITSDPPGQGDAPSSVTVGSGRGSFPFKLSNDTVKQLIEEAASADGGIQAVKDDLLEALDLD